MPKAYCTKGHQPGEHDVSCMPPADPHNPELRLIRAIYGLCPICDVTDFHQHSDQEYLDATMVPPQKPPANMRVVFSVRCHGEPNENVENMIMDRISEAVNEPQIGWGILTIGRQYYHDDGRCEGHADPGDKCERLG